MTARETTERVQYFLPYSVRRILGRRRTVRDAAKSVAKFHFIFLLKLFRMRQKR